MSEIEPLEEFVTRLCEEQGEIGISQIVSRGLTYDQADKYLLKLHGEGVVRYSGAEQVGGEKVARLIT
jgi:hypothetical protein